MTCLEPTSLSSFTTTRVESNTSFVAHVVFSTTVPIGRHMLMADIIPRAFPNKHSFYFNNPQGKKFRWLISNLRSKASPSRFSSLNIPRTRKQVCFSFSCFKIRQLFKHSKSKCNLHTFYFRIFQLKLKNVLVIVKTTR